MPLLVLYSRLSRDSRILRETAQRIGLDTLRLEGYEIPDWVDRDVQDVAIFATMPVAQLLAEAFSRTLVGCDADWLPNLPKLFLRREVERTTLGDALSRSHGRFLKSAITKQIAGKIWEVEELKEAAGHFDPELHVLLAEPVTFLVEYRCFVAGRKILAISPYRRFGVSYDESQANLGETSEELKAATEFANSVLSSPDVHCPPGFVIDVGLIDGRGWAVVEANECWASGIYYCDPVKMLDVLFSACISDSPRTAVHQRWDFATHYTAAVPK